MRRALTGEPDATLGAIDREADLLRRVRNLLVSNGELRIRIRWYRHRIHELEGLLWRQWSQAVAADPRSSRAEDDLRDRQLASLQLELERKEGVIQELRVAAEERLRIIEELPRLREQLAAREAEIKRLVQSVEHRPRVLDGLRRRLMHKHRGDDPRRKDGV
jgi:hypothetical protein